MLFPLPRMPFFLSSAQRSLAHLSRHSSPVSPLGSLPWYPFLTPHTSLGCGSSSGCSQHPSWAQLCGCLSWSPWNLLCVHTFPQQTFYIWKTQRDLLPQVRACAFLINWKVSRCNNPQSPPSPTLASENVQSLPGSSLCAQSPANISYAHSPQDFDHLVSPPWNILSILFIWMLATVQGWVQILLLVKPSDCLSLGFLSNVSRASGLCHLQGI